MNGSVMYVCYVNKSFHIYLTLKIMLHNWFSNGVQCSAWKIFFLLSCIIRKEMTTTPELGGLSSRGHALAIALHILSDRFFM